MAESQEVLQSQKQEIPTLQINGQNEIKKIENKSSIVNRYQELKSSIGDVQNRINTFLDTVRIDDQNLPDGRLITLPELDQQVNQLNEKEGITSTQYLLESQEIKFNVAVLNKTYSASSADLGQKISEVNDQISQIDDQLDSISNQSRLKKTFSSLGSFILKQKKADLEIQKTNFENQKVTAEAKKSELQRITQEIEKRRQESLSDEITKNLQEIKSSCLKFVEDTLNDKVFLGEMRENLIKKIIEPKIESLQKERGSDINEKNKKEFLTTLRESLDPENLTDDEKQKMQTKLEDFFTYKGGFSEIKDDKRDLLDGEADKEYISCLLKHCLVVDLNLKNTADKLNLEGTGIKKDDIETITSKVNSYKEHHENGQRIIEPALTSIHAEEMTGPHEFHYLFSWMRALEDSASFPKFFDDQLKELDNNIHSVAMKESLTDTEGGYIDFLCYYSDPETIRNLVIIAATERDRYNNCHANYSLTSLAGQSNWPQILDQAEKKYPELKKARPVLMNFNFTQQDHEPNIQKAAADLSLRIFQEETVDPKLKKLAERALINKEIAMILVKNLAITQDEAKTLESASRLLYGLDENNKNYHSAENYIDSYSINAAVRECLLSLITNPNSPDQAKRAELARLIVLSNEINIQKNNLQVVSYLSSASIVECIKKNLSGEQMDLLFRLYEEVPELTRHREIKTIIINYPDIFLSKEGLAYVNEFSQAYNKRDAYQMEAVLDLVGASKLSEEKALNLSNNKDVLDYITSSEILFFIRNHNLTESQTDLLLDSYIKVPILKTSSQMKNSFTSFYNDFLTEDGLRYLNELSKAYGGSQNEERLNTIFRLIGLSKLSKERALEVPNESKTILLENNPSCNVLLQANPQFFLGTKERISLFDQLVVNGDINLVDMDLQRLIGRQMIEEELKNSDLNVENTVMDLGLKKFALNPQFEIDKNNWQELLLYFVKANGGNNIRELPEGALDKIKGLFEDKKTKNFCLNEINQQWINYLSYGSYKDTPIGFLFFSKYLNKIGAGPLTQIEAQNNFITSFYNFLSRKTVAKQTKENMFKGLKDLEEKTVKEKWSNDDKKDFYIFSETMIKLDPDIYLNYLNLFKKLNSAEFKRLNREILPLHKVKLVLTEKNKTHSFEALLGLKADIEDLTENIGKDDRAFETQKDRLLVEITSIFKDKFGIIKVSEDFTQEDIESITNISKYLSNLNLPNKNKENIIGFYLSLLINNKWDDFRRGEEIDPSEYLIPEKTNDIKSILELRAKNNPLTVEALGIDSGQIGRFNNLLQEEIQNVMIGNVQTVDVKLNNVILNLKELEDPDLYQDKLDKDRMGLLLSHGNKKVGSVISRIYQQGSNPQKQVEFLEEDLIIKGEIEKIFTENNLVINPQTIKEYFQDGLKPFSTIVNLLQFVKETEVERGITDIQSLIQPNQKIVDIFNRLGENFKPTSGAMALSQDLDYLDNIINKKEDKLQPEEKEELNKYISSIRNKVVELENVYQKIKNKFMDMAQGQINTNNELLKERNEQINQILNTQNTQQVITSTITNNFNTIMKNIRACLSCQTNGCNNDTDLTFGDMNKFYVYSQSENDKNTSISDQIVFVEPIIRQDGRQEIAFVLDRIYGESNTPLILENQAETVIKKFHLIKKAFPDIKLSVLISDAAMSGKLSTDMLIQKLSESKIKSRREENIEVNITESATGDHYAEFGGKVRSSGKRKVNGVIIDS